MSGYCFYSFHFVVRPGRAADLATLTAVANGTAPSADELARLHPVARYYLADVRRFLADELEPRVGSPVRLARSPISTTPPRTRLSIELCFHDDDFAHRGYAFWIWVLSLVEPPAGGAREVIGYDGLYRNDPETGLITSTADGITDRHGITLSYDDIDSVLAAWDGPEDDQGPVYRPQPSR